MRRLIGTLFLVVLLAPGPARADEVVRVTAVPHHPLFPPILFVMTEVYRRAGLSIRLVELPPRRALAVSGTGGADAELARSAGLEHLYPDLIRLPTPCYTMHVRAFGLDTDIRIRSRADLARYRIVVYRGAIEPDRLTEGMSRVVVDRSDQVVRLLASGRADVVVTGAPHMNDAAPDVPLPRPIVPVGPSLLDVPMYHYVHKSRPGVAKRVEDVLAAMQASGELAALQREAAARYP